MKNDVAIRWVIRFPDGKYLAPHKKPCAADGREWYKHGRKVSFNKARIFQSLGGARGSLIHLKEDAQIMEVYVSEPIEIKTPEKELV